jgi:glycerophosphoryl diester phosphodiesterase
MKPTVIALSCVLLSFGAVLGQYHRIMPGNVAGLRELFHYDSLRIAMISAHRGGPEAGYPENCIPTFDKTLSRHFAIIEFDVQLSKDGKLVVMHDSTLDRTSDGTGKVSEKTWKELKKIRLEDTKGKITSYKMPTLDQVLAWAKKRTVLTVDIKRGLSPKTIVEAIQKNKAHHYAIIITYSLETAKEYYKLDSGLFFSVTVRNMEDLRRLDESGIPARQVFAFVGLREPDKALYDELHRRGILCMVGTMHNLDNKFASGEKDVFYNLIKNGADMLSSDLPADAYRTIQPLNPKNSPKSRFFRVR